MVIIVSQLCGVSSEHCSTSSTGCISLTSLHESDCHLAAGSWRRRRVLWYILYYSHYYNDITKLPECLDVPEHDQQT